MAKKQNKQTAYAARVEREPYTITEAQRDAAKARRPFNKAKDKAARKGA